MAEVSSFVFYTSFRCFFFIATRRQYEGSASSLQQRFVFPARL
jgi:hypothetical protein